MTFDHSTYRCGNYSREETIQGRKLYEEIRYVLLFTSKIIRLLKTLNFVSLGSVFAFLNFLSDFLSQSKLMKRLSNFEIEQNTNFANLPSAKWLLFVHITINFIIQDLKFCKIAQNICASFPLERIERK